MQRRVQLASARRGQRARPAPLPHAQHTATIPECPARPLDFGDLVIAAREAWIAGAPLRSQPTGPVPAACQRPAAAARSGMGFEITHLQADGGVGVGAACSRRRSRRHSLPPPATALQHPHTLPPCSRPQDWSGSPTRRDSCMCWRSCTIRRPLTPRRRPTGRRRARYSCPPAAAAAATSMWHVPLGGWMSWAALPTTLARWCCRWVLQEGVRQHVGAAGGATRAVRSAPRLGLPFPQQMPLAEACHVAVQRQAGAPGAAPPRLRVVSFSRQGSRRSPDFEVALGALVSRLAGGGR